jgi:AcrR family transcriptional regulator
MRSVRSGDQDDLTTKARIRDTAIAMIGRSGFTATTVRAIAAGVGVSPALLLHHFGSKDGLREACNEHVLGWYAAQLDEIARDDSPDTIIGMIDRTPEMLPLAAYIRRSLIDGGAFARQIFDSLVADTARYLDRSVASGRVRPTADPHGRAVLMVITSLGSQLLAEYLMPPHTPADQLISAASQQLMLPGLELYTYGLFTDPAYLDTYRRRQQQHPDGTVSSRPTQPSS